MLTTSLRGGIAITTLVLAGVGIVGLAVTANDETDTPGPVDSEAAAAAEPVASTDQVAFWQARVDADSADFVSRTQLASALLGRALADHNTIDAIAADAEIDKVLAVVPDDTSATLVKASTRMFVHDFPGGLGFAQRVLAKDPTHKVAIAIAGDAQFELGDLDAAAATYEQLGARVGVSPEVTARRARIAHARGDTDAAIAYAQQANQEAVDLGLFPEDSTYYRFLLAELQRGAGLYVAAAESYRAVLDINDTDGSSIEGLGKAEAGLGNLDEADRWWARSGELIGAPDFHVLAARGDIAFARGDEARAEQLWAEALDAVAALLPEEQVGFLRDVSRFRSSHGLDVDEALRLAEADFDIRQDAYAYETLAWAQLATGDAEAARVNIDLALATGVEDATVWYHAAEIYAANGDETQASDYATQVLELSPAFDVFEAPRAEALRAGR